MSHPLTDPWFDAHFIADAPDSPLGSFRKQTSMTGACGLFLWCPCSYGKDSGAHRLIVPFTNAPEHNFLIRSRDGLTKPKWTATGTGLADLSCAPSIDVGTPSCWHGYITNGVVIP